VNKGTTRQRRKHDGRDTTLADGTSPLSSWNMGVQIVKKKGGSAKRGEGDYEGKKAAHKNLTHRWKRKEQEETNEEGNGSRCKCWSG